MDKVHMTKTRLYQLASKYSIYPVPSMKETEIWHYSGTYWLEFYSVRKDDLDTVPKLVKVIWDVFWGEKILRVQCKAEKYDEIFHPTDDELAEIGALPSEKES